MKKGLILIIWLSFFGLNDAISQWTTVGNNIYNSNTGNVGIGNNAPTTLLHAAKLTTEPTITIQNLGGAGGATYTMIDALSGANWKFKATNSGGFKIRDHANLLDVIVIEPNSAANAIYINGAGSVGLGTSAPGSGLNVANGGLAIGSGAGISTTHGAKRSLQILTDTYYGGLYDNHSGFLVYSTMPAGWGNATLNFAVSTSWGEYNTSDPILTIGGSGVGIGTTSPAASAALDVSSTSKGFLPPRMTQAEIRYIENPLEGLIVFCTSNNKFYAYASNAWKDLSFGSDTFTPFSCGANLPINHTAGDVAPVSKAVTYGTVTGIPGEPSKCWITSNLGADHQASSVTDATEASAGWYWQFNRMQGYKHDGTTRTPNTTWISSIDENSNWLTANDPCALLLGAGWRLPTQTEWTNVNASGGWVNWNGPWSSALKMHAAGYLSTSSGSLGGRGFWGYDWSSSQVGNSSGWSLHFGIDYCMVFNDSKAAGIPSRCLRD